MDQYIGADLKNVDDPLAPGVIGMGYLKQNNFKDDEPLEELVIELELKPHFREKHITNDQRCKQVMIHLDSKPSKMLVKKEDSNAKLQKYPLPQTPKDDEDSYFIIQLKDKYHCPSCDFVSQYLPIIKEHINSQHKLAGKKETSYLKKEIIDSVKYVAEES